MATQFKAFQDKLLTNVSNKYVPQGFVAEQVLPSIKTGAYTGKIAKYGSSFLRLENTNKGGRSKFRRVDTQARSTQGYEIEGHGLEGMVTKEDYRNFIDTPFNAERDETYALQTILQIEKEKMLADALTSTAIITQNTTLAGASQWDSATGTPLTQITAANGLLIDATGGGANVAIMDVAVWNKIRFNPQFIDTLGYKYSRPGGLNDSELASVLGVDRLLISRVRYNAAKEGQADNMVPVWGKDIVFAVAPQVAAMDQISLGYLVTLEGESPRQVYKWDLYNPPGSAAILVEDNYDMIISNANAGYLIKNVIA